MRLSSLYLSNFKAIGSTEQLIQFKPITLLYGPNSAGKSTIVQALHYLSEILERNNCDPGTTRIGGKLNLGGFRNLVHLHDPDTTIEIGICLFLENSLLPSYHDIFGSAEEDEHVRLGELLGTQKIPDLSEVQSLDVKLGVSWSRQLNHAYVSFYSVGFNGEHFATLATSADQKQTNLKSLNFEHSMFAVPREEDPEAETVGNVLQSLVDELTVQASSISGVENVTPLQIVSSFGALPEFDTLLPLSAPGDAVEDVDSDVFSQFTHYISRVIVGAGELSRDCLREFLYLGPLREIPGRHYIPELSPGLDRWSSGLGAWDQLYNEGDQLVDKINAWLADDKRLDAGYEIRFGEYKPLYVDSPLMVALQSDSELLQDPEWLSKELKSTPTKRQITLKDLRTNIELHPEDLGTGISQVLPVLVAALGHNKNIVAIEQPELHVHPKFQVELGELFIHAIKEEGIARDTVFILETHSEYMMLRFLRRLFETANDELPPGVNGICPDDIAVYYVNPLGDATDIVPLRLTEDGEFLDRWPHGFFPERKRELF
ncbi:AAA family ATPase [Marinobacter sp. Arc7-DN-1]|uniref:AAA family ATPase n=1 Tax=Marinobacter sp. Arc7-DN-1 TaxID=2304594 RepID=UPI000E44CC7B|nr:DUF3696 domain-containing protein [Marinobacter sp. Arc7-DN-1]AXS81891.1 hypothetical protein D0851_01845 [Marinobacter sp. Arc7-DN-1]